MQYLAQTDMWQLDRAVSRQPMSRVLPSRILAKFSQVFPLKLIPDDVIIEELRIVWVKRDGIWSDEIISIMATDIACVDATAGPFFGHIHIRSLTGGQEIVVDRLHRADAFQIRSLVEAIAISARSGIQLENEDLQDEKAKLIEMGRVKFD